MRSQFFQTALPAHPVHRDHYLLGELDVPVPGQGEVLLEVRAAGVDMGVWHLLTGKPYLLRFLGFGFRGPKSPVPGRDVAGVVTAIGPGVT